MTSYLPNLIKSVLFATLALYYQPKEITTPLSPAPVAPYSHGIQVGPTLYLTGTIGTDPKTGEMVSNSTMTQAYRALLSSKAVLNAANMSFKNVAKVVIFMTNMDDLPAVNNVYKKFFKKPYPARSAVEVTKLPVDAKIMIEMIAAR